MLITAIYHLSSFMKYIQTIYMIRFYIKIETVRPKGTTEGGKFTGTFTCMDSNTQGEYIVTYDRPGKVEFWL